MAVNLFSNRIKMLNAYSNIDYLYGPYHISLNPSADSFDISSVDDLLNPSNSKYIGNVVKEGFTIAVIDESGEMEEKWIKRIGNLLLFVTKIEEYKFTLSKSGDSLITINNDTLTFNYNLQGKGLIKSAIIELNGIIVKNFNPIVGNNQSISISKPKDPNEYVYKLYIIDIYNNSSNVLELTIEIGSILFSNINMSSVLNVKPKNISNFSNKGYVIKFKCKHLPSIVISDITLGCDGDNIEVSREDDNESYIITISSLVEGIHKLTAHYTKVGNDSPQLYEEPDEKYSFTVLSQDHIHIKCENFTLFENEQVKIPIHIESGSDNTVVVLITGMSGKSKTFQNVKVNEDLQLICNYSELFDAIKEDTNIKINITVNSSKKEVLVYLKNINYSLFEYDYTKSDNQLKLYQKGYKLVGSSDDCEIEIVNSSDGCSIDMTLKILRNLSNDKLVTITFGNNYAHIYEDKIETNLIDSNVCNKIVIPKTDDLIHIGFGINRVGESIKDGGNVYFNSVHINGIIVCNKKLDKKDETQSIPSITINSPIYIRDYNINCSDNLNATLEHKDYPKEFDTIFYNYLVAFSNKQNNLNITSNTLELININSLVNTTMISEGLNLVSIGTAGIKSDLNSTSRPSDLISMVTNLKEDYQDKLATICIYKLNSSESDGDWPKYGFLEMHTLGTSTLDYAIPNFKFTFLEYNNSLGKFKEIETGIKLINSWTDGETKLTAKVDYMDSSHLNNTPTCTFINNFIKEFNLNEAVDEKEKLKSPAVLSGYLDAIEGDLFILKYSDNYLFAQNTNLASLNIENCFNGNSLSLTNLGSIMLNIDKKGKNLNLENCISLEGSSNAKSSDVNSGNGAMFTRTEDTNNDVELVEGLVVLTNSESDFSDLEGYILLENSGFEPRGIKYKKMTPDDKNEICRMWYFGSLPDDSGTNDPYLSDDFFEDPSNASKDITMFRNYFEEIFDKNYAMFYFINLMCFGQVDNLGKNMMIDCWKTKISNDDNDENDENDEYTYSKWYFRPYDLDSECGLTNQGTDVVPEYVEIDEAYHKTENKEKGKYLYSSKDSTFWKNFVKCFKNDINSYYKILRENGYGPEKIIETAKSLVIDKMSERLCNYDFYYKYIGTNEQKFCFGNRWEKFLQWITNRFMFCDTYFDYYDTLLIVPQKESSLQYKVSTPVYLKSYSLQGENSAQIQFVKDESDPILFSLGVLHHINTSNSAVIELKNITNCFPINTFNTDPIFENIKTLYIHGDKSNIKDIGVLNISNFDNLLSLDLDYVKGINTLQIPKSLAVLKISNYSGLLSLDFSESESLNKIELDNINLSDLNIEGIETLTDISLKNVICESILLTDLQNLTKLTTNNCSYSNITFSGNIGLETIELHDNNISNVLFTNNQNEILKVLKICLNITNESESSLKYIRPGITSLNISNLKALEELDCHGCENLEEIIFDDLWFDRDGDNLIIKKNNFILNVQGCKHLTKFGKTNDTLDFTNFSNLESNAVKLFTSYINSSSRASVYTIKELPNHFNLAGCCSIKKVKNLEYNGQGDYLFGACIELSELDNCKISVTNTIDYMLYGCNSLNKFTKTGETTNTSLSNCITINLNVSSCSNTFVYTKLTESLISNALASCKSNITNYSGAFASKDWESVTLSNLIGNKASDLNNCFSGGLYTLYEIDDNVSDHYLNILHMLIRGIHPSKKSGVTSNISNLSTISGNLPSTVTSMIRFAAFNKNLTSINENIIKDCTSLTSLKSAFGITKVSTIIQFPNTNIISDISCLYDRTDIEDNISVIGDGTDETSESKIKSEFKKLKALEKAECVFKDCVKLELDVEGLFTECNYLDTIAGAFRGCTKISCTGKIFNNCVKNITSLFAYCNSNLSLNWINSNYNFTKSGLSVLGADSHVSITDLGGIFLKNIISNMPNMHSFADIPINSMFENCTINAGDLDFRIYSKIADKLFKNATCNNVENIFLTNTVNFSEGLYNFSSTSLTTVTFDLTTTENINKCFAKSSNSISGLQNYLTVLNIKDMQLPKNIKYADYLFENLEIKKGSDDTISVESIFNLLTRLNTCVGMFRNTNILLFSSHLPNTVVDCSELFQACTKLLNCSNIFNSNNTNLKKCSNLFENNTSLESINLTFNNILNVEDMSNMFKNSGTLGGSISIGNGNINLNSLMSADSMFEDCKFESAIAINSTNNSVTANDMFKNSSLTDFTSNNPVLTRAWIAEHPQQEQDN